MAEYVAVNKEYFKCQVCFETMDLENHYPMTLPCLHVFCSSCIHNMTDRSTVTCPNCSGRYNQSEVKKDFRIVGLLDDFKNIQKEEKRKKELNESDSDELLCEICEEIKGVVAKCNDCNYLMCRICEKSHKKTNPGHNKISLVQIVKQIKEKIKVSQSKCKHLINSSQSALDDLEKRTVEVATQKNGVLQQIEKSRKETIDLVNKQHDKLKDKLNTQVTDFTRSLNGSKERLTKHKMKLHEVNTNLGQLILNENSNHILNDGMVILQCVQKDIESMENALKEHGECKNVCSITVNRTEQPLCAIDIDVKCSAISTDPEPKHIFKDLPTEYTVDKAVDLPKRCGRRIRSHDNQLYVTTNQHMLVYDSEGELLQTVQFKHGGSNVLSSIVSNDSFVITDFDKGLYLLNRVGDVMSQIVGGKYSDICMYENKLYALEWKKGVVYVFSVCDNKITNCNEIKLHGYTKGADYNRMSVDHQCIYVSSRENDCIDTYSHSGDHLSTNGKYGEDRTGTINGVLSSPLLCNTDTAGSVLVADCYNHRLQVLDSNGDWSVITLPESVVCPTDALPYPDNSTLWLLTLDKLYKLLVVE